MQNRDVLVVFHNNCLDGSGAAYAARMTDLCDRADFYPASYTDAKNILLILTGPNKPYKEVYFLDFCLKREEMLEIADAGVKITVLDHHKTAHEEVGDIYEIDQTKSGAVLAWEHFHPSTPVPKGLLHIQDRDLWQWKMDKTREYTTSVYSECVNRDFADVFNDSLESHIERGTHLVQYIENMNQLVIRNNTTMVTVGRYNSIPLCNCPGFMSSDIGNMLSKEHAPFAVMYERTSGGFQVSLRSNAGNPNHVDVSEVAKKFGGGGHKHAAGFNVPFYHAKDIRDVLRFGGEYDRWTKVKNFFTMILDMLTDISKK